VLKGLCVAVLRGALCAADDRKVVKKPVKKVAKKVVKKAALKPVAKKAAPKPAPKRNEPIKRSQIRNSGATTSDLKASRQFAKRGSSFSLQQMFGFTISKDSKGRKQQSYEKPLNIIK
jgi:hypothetical protein